MRYNAKMSDDMVMDLSIRAVNPELFSLLNRVKTIYAICGGEVPKVDKKKMHEFDYKKSVVIAHMNNIDQLCEIRDKKSGLATDSVEYIRLKNQVNIEMRSLMAEVDDLATQNTRELEKKGSKMAVEEINARKEVMNAILNEYRSTFKKVKGYDHQDSEEMAQGGAGMTTITREQLAKGTFAGAGVKTKREELSGEHMQKMELIRKEVTEQDDILDEISKGLDDLKDAAEKIHDELQLQEKMLDELDKKTDKAQDKLDKVNDRMKDALAKLNDKSTNICLYGICFIILLAVAAIVYNMLVKK